MHSSLSLGRIRAPPVRRVGPRSSCPLSWVASSTPRWDGQTAQAPSQPTARLRNRIYDNLDEGKPADSYLNPGPNKGANGTFGSAGFGDAGSYSVPGAAGTSGSGSGSGADEGGGAGSGSAAVGSSATWQMHGHSAELGQEQLPGWDGDTGQEVWTTDLGSGDGAAGPSAWDPSGDHTAGSNGQGSANTRQGGSAWSERADWGEAESLGDWGERVQQGGGTWGTAAAAGPFGRSDQPAGSTGGVADSEWYGGQAGQQQQQQQQWQGRQGSGADFSAFTASASQQGPVKGRWGGSGQRAYGAAGQTYGSSATTGPPPAPSDITLIAPRDADTLLPVLPTPGQARFYQPKSVPEKVVQVLGSFGASVALSKSAILAGPALLFPVWGPWIRAGVRNVELYLKQFKCVGLWRAQVLSVVATRVPFAVARGLNTPPADSVSLIVGDPWPNGARVDLVFPYQLGAEDIVTGEPAELLVLCQDQLFQQFKVVREVYLPQTGLWLSEYPFVSRDLFLDISLAVERARQQAQPPAQPAAAAAGPGGGSSAGNFGGAGTGVVYNTIAYDAAANGREGNGYASPAGVDARRPPASSSSAWDGVESPSVVWPDDMWQDDGAAVLAIKFDPCEPIQPVRSAGSMVIGVAYWPGGKLEDWGTAEASLNPCNETDRANLTAAGVYFSTYNMVVDRLSLLKTSLSEELYITGKAAAGSPQVISVVAFRANVRSDPRYIVSFEPSLTTGTGFVSTLSLVTKFKTGTLELLQWYNLTCNDCGGASASNLNCIAKTSCAEAAVSCTCPTDNSTAADSGSGRRLAQDASPSPDPISGTCSLANFTSCATSINVAFDGVDMNSRAFQTASQVRVLNSYSLVALYNLGKQKFFDVKDRYADGPVAAAWGRFGELSTGVADAYSEDGTGRTTGTANSASG